MIYVDKLFTYPEKRKLYCHMATDGPVPELHAFAKRIGMKRHWFKGGRLPHYDLIAGMRDKAVRAGAVEVDSKTLYRQCFGFISKPSRPF